MKKTFMNKLAGLVLLIAISITMLCSTAFAKPAEPESPKIKKIIFGSCLDQAGEQRIWKPINAQTPDLFVFLGDNIYGDTQNMEVLQSKYNQLGDNVGFQQLRASTPIVATWDDHDYGTNDGGHDYPFKEESRAIMLDFFEEPRQSQRRTRDSGIYTSYYFGKGKQRVQLILSDLRWNRKITNPPPWYEYLWSVFVSKKGPYQPVSDNESIMFGEAQWQWLENQLEEPAAIRIFASSLQVIPNPSNWEAWAVFPNERGRLLSMLSKAQQDAFFIISGDTHWAEFSKLNYKNTPVLELTSSGLSKEWEAGPNPLRVGGSYSEANFGMIEIDWEKQHIKLSINDIEGKERMSEILAF